jgi:hypothetical protein
MNKNFFLFAFILFQFNIYVGSQTIDEIKIDIENLARLGKRPISMGKELYINGQGSIQNTSGKLDFAIHGKGFFVLYNKEKNKIIMSRNGSFVANSENLLINSDGYFALNEISNFATGEYVYIDADLLYKYEDSNPFANRGVFSPLVYNKVIYPFLIVYPRDVMYCEIIDPENCFFSEFQICETNNYSIYRGAMEEMPLDIKELLNKFVGCFNLPFNKYEIGMIYDLFTRKYTEIKGETVLEKPYSDSIDNLLSILSIIWANRGP